MSDPVTGDQLINTMSERSKSDDYPNVNDGRFDEWCVANGLVPEGVNQFMDEAFPSFIRLLLDQYLENQEAPISATLKRTVQAVLLGTFILAWDVSRNGPVE